MKVQVLARWRRLRVVDAVPPARDRAVSRRRAAGRSSRRADVGRAIARAYARWSAYLAAVTRPDGLMPQVGDADDGRLHVFEGYGDGAPQDGRHLFGPAGVMFDEPAWLALGGDAGDGKRRGGASALTASLDPRSGQRSAVLFPDAGIAVAPTGARALPAGHQRYRRHQRVRQSQAQRSAGVRISPRRHPADCRSRAATSTRRTPMPETGFAARRTTTPCMIDGVEQNELRPDWLFRLFETSQRRIAVIRRARRCRGVPSAGITATSGCRSR